MLHLPSIPDNADCRSTPTLRPPGADGIESSFERRPGSIESRAICRSHKINAAMSRTNTLFEYTDASETESICACHGRAEWPAPPPFAGARSARQGPAAGLAESLQAPERNSKDLEQRHPGDYAQRYKTNRNNSGNHAGDTDVAERTCCRAHPAAPPKSCCISSKLRSIVTAVTRVFDSLCERQRRSYTRLAGCQCDEIRPRLSRKANQSEYPEIPIDSIGTPTTLLPPTTSQVRHERIVSPGVADASKLSASG